MSNRPAKSNVSSNIGSRCVRAPGAGALVLHGLVLAQNARADVALDEIVITAQKREQRLQDVPIAVSVVGGSPVEQTGGLTAQSLKRSPVFWHPGALRLRGQVTRDGWAAAG